MSKGHDSHSGHHLHVTPFWPMMVVFVLLLILTALTVWSANIHEFRIGNTTIEIGGTAHIVIALAIASLKSALVLGFFMHLIYDKVVNTIIAASTFFGIIAFIGLTLMDIAVRADVMPIESTELKDGGTAQIVDKATARGEAEKANAYAEGKADEKKDDEKAQDEDSGDAPDGEDAPDAM